MRLLQRLLLLALAHLHHGASSTALADKEDGGSSGDLVCRGQCQRLNLWQLRVPATGSSVLLGIIKAAGAPTAHAPRGGPCDACSLGRDLEEWRRIT